MAGFLRVRVAWTTTPQGGLYLSTHNFFGDTQTEANDAVSAVGTFWGAVDAVIQNQYVWRTEALVDNLAFDGTLLGSFVTTPQTGTGGASTERLPYAVQGLITWRSSGVVNGRRVIGRTFIPGLTESSNSEGIWTSTQRTTVDNAAEALIADANSVLGVWSQTNTAIFNAVSADVSPQFAVLRSRRD